MYPMKRFQVKEIKISTRMTTSVRGTSVKNATGDGGGNTGGSITSTVGGGD